MERKWKIFLFVFLTIIAVIAILVFLIKKKINNDTELNRKATDVSLQKKNYEEKIKEKQRKKIEQKLEELSVISEDDNSDGEESEDNSGSANGSIDESEDEINSQKSKRDREKGIIDKLKELGYDPMANVILSNPEDIAKKLKGLGQCK